LSLCERGAARVSADCTCGARAFEEAGAKQAQDEGAAEEKGGLAACEVLNIVDQSPKVILLKVVRDAFHLGCCGFDIAGYGLLILLSQLLAGLP